MVCVYMNVVAWVVLYTCILVIFERITSRSYRLTLLSDTPMDSNMTHLLWLEREGNHSITDNIHEIIHPSIQAGHRQATQAGHTGRPQAGNNTTLPPVAPPSSPVPSHPIHTYIYTYVLTYIDRSYTLVPPLEYMLAPHTCTPCRLYPLP